MTRVFGLIVAGTVAALALVAGKANGQDETQAMAVSASVHDNSAIQAELAALRERIAELECAAEGTGGMGRGGFCLQENCSCDSCSRRRRNRCRPPWTVSADALVLRRDRVDNLPLVVDPGSGASLYTGGDINLDFQTAPRISIARRLFDRHDIEFEFFSLNSLRDTATIASPGAQFTLYGATFGTQPIDLAFSSHLYNGELNWRSSWCNDRVRTLAGFRWLELGDDARVVDAVSPPGLYAGNLINRLYGFQLGVEGTLLKYRRFELEAGCKGGVYGNGGCFTTEFPQAGPAAGFTARGNKTAFVGEVMIGLNYQLTKSLALRAGYQGIWMEGVALQIEQWDDLAVPISGELNMNGRPIYHGYHLGLHCSF